MEELVSLTESKFLKINQGQETASVYPCTQLDVNGWHGLGLVKFEIFWTVQSVFRFLENHSFCLSVIKFDLNLKDLSRAIGVFSQLVGGCKLLIVGSVNLFTFLGHRELTLTEIFMLTIIGLKFYLSLIQVVLIF